MQVAWFTVDLHLSNVMKKLRLRLGFLIG
uniref:Uncharacterized protein n=1 Tax=Anguilla anguilla TaxID=7936 RepID=A0A0E9TVQ8_ANGAN